MTSDTAHPLSGRRTLGWTTSSSELQMAELQLLEDASWTSSEIEFRSW
jgi:hypothetical protein